MNSLCADLFDTTEYPSVRLALTGVQQLPHDGYSISAKLTVKGITQNISLEASLKSSGDQQVVLTPAPPKLNRKWRNASFDHPAEEVVLKDDFQISFSAEATGV